MLLENASAHLFLSQHVAGRGTGTFFIHSLPRHLHERAGIRVALYREGWIAETSLDLELSVARHVDSVFEVK